MKKNLLIILSVIAVAGVAYFVYSNNKNQPPANNNNVPIAQCGEDNKKEQANIIGNNISQYATSTKDLIGKSTEGGQQINYSLDGKNILIKQTFYSETGKSEVTYYLDNGKVFYFTKKNYIYALPLSQDSSGKVKSIESNEFYLATDQSLCSWSSDGSVQSNTQAAKDTVNFLLTDLQ